MAVRSWPCKVCGHTVESWGMETECPKCETPYNAFGQELRKGWQNNPSLYDDDISDLDGYEMSLRDD